MWLREVPVSPHQAEGFRVLGRRASQYLSLRPPQCPLPHLLQRDHICHHHCVPRRTHEGQQAAVRADSHGVPTGLRPHYVSCQNWGGV